MVEDSSSSEMPTGHKSELYREVTPDAFWGYIRPGHLETTFFTTQMDAIGPITGNKPKAPEYIAETHIKFTPQMAKMYALWLLERLILYEELFGKIVVAEETDLADKKPLGDIKSKFAEFLK